MRALLLLLLASCEAAPSALAPLARPAAYAVVRSDYSSTAIALLDSEGAILDEAWLHSGSAVPGLVAALSGDVVLPTVGLPGALVLIDRFRADVLTRVDLASFEIAQVRAHDPAEGVGFSSNPHDLVAFDDGLWVTRYSASLDAPAARGTDLVRVDFATGTRGRRISLASLDATATATTDAGPRTLPTPARPSRAVHVGDRLLVGLDRLSPAFDAAGPGALARVGERVEEIALPALRLCGRVVPIPGEPQRAIAACKGFARPYGEPVETRRTAGLARVGPAGIETLWLPADDPSRPIAVENVVALDAHTVVATALGSGGANDALFEIDLDTGAHAAIHTSEAFALGVPAYDAARGLLLVPDAARGVLRFRRDAGGWAKLPEQRLEGLGLPARHIARLAVD